MLWEFRKSHPRTQLLKERFLLGKSNTHTKKGQNQAHTHVLHWNEHITWASVFDSVASYKCPSWNCHSSFIMWIHKNQLHGHQCMLGCICVRLQSEAALGGSDELTTAQGHPNSTPDELHSIWTPLQITTGQQVSASRGLLLLHTRPSILELGWLGKNIKTLNRVEGIQREKSFTV